MQPSRTMQPSLTLGGIHTGGGATFSCALGGFREPSVQYILRIGGSSLPVSPFTLLAAGTNARCFSRLLSLYCLKRCQITSEEGEAPTEHVALRSVCSVPPHHLSMRVHRARAGIPPRPVRNVEPVGNKTCVRCCCLRPSVS